MTKPTFYCREIEQADWPTILRIQSEVYYAFTPESEAVMRSKATHGPLTSFVAVDQNAAIVAYCLAHPYPANRAAVLGRDDPLPMTPTDNLYVHDLAVQKASAGRGVAHTLFNHLASTARLKGYRTMSLVAVQQAASFWRKLGFIPAAQSTINDSYTGAATFMTKAIDTATGSE